MIQGETDLPQKMAMGIRAMSARSANPLTHKG